MKKYLSLYLLLVGLLLSSAIKAQFTAYAVVDSNVSCYGLKDGGAKVIASGGQSPYLYSWSNGASTSIIAGLDVGNYTVTVSDDLDSTVFLEIAITQPTELAASAFLIQDATCHLKADGGASAYAMGGTSPYNYSWSNGQTNSTLLGYQAGNYSVTITDTEGCFDTTSVVIGGPDSLYIVISTANDVSCKGLSDGTISTSVIGGTSPYTYSWSNGNSTSSISNLPASTYILSVTDVNSCKASSTTVIEESDSVQLSVLVSSNASCNGFSDGAAIAGGSGGGGGYSYAWSGGSVDSARTDLVAGSHTVTVSDINGCKMDSSIVIAQPNAIISNVTIDSTISCFGNTDGAATVIASGGMGGFAYLWSGGETDSSVSGLAGGQYIVTVTDSTSCEDVSALSIYEPSVLGVTTSIIEEIICYNDNNGKIVSTPTGGTTPYSYLWSNSQTDSLAINLTTNTYYITITDSNNCVAIDSLYITQPTKVEIDSFAITHVQCEGVPTASVIGYASGGTGTISYLWSTSEIVPSIINLAAGDYYLTVTDSSSCQDIDTATVTENILPQVVAMSPDTVLCLGDQLLLYGSGAQTYTWNNGVTDSVAFSPSVTTTYSVTGTFADACFKIDDIVVVVYDLPSVYTSNDTTICDVDFVTLSGNGAQTYVWDNGITDGVAFSPSSTTTYSVTGTDNNQCIDTAQIVITVNITPTVSAVNEAKVEAGQSVQLSSTVTNAFDILWTPDLGLSETNIENPIASPLATTTYTITGTSGEGCVAKDSVVVTVEDELIISNFVSPNADGNNDVWKVYPQDALSGCNVQIINEFGNVVFQTNAYNSEWDGTKNGSVLPDGNYYYIIECESVIKTGTITLIR